MKKIKRPVVGLVAAAALLAAGFGAGVAEARYEVPDTVSECPPGTHLVLQGNPSLPGYPRYCAPI